MMLALIGGHLPILRHVSASQRLEIAPLDRSGSPTVPQDKPARHRLGNSWTHRWAQRQKCFEWNHTVCYVWRCQNHSKSALSTFIYVLLCCSQRYGEHRWTMYDWHSAVATGGSTTPSPRMESGFCDVCQISCDLLYNFLRTFKQIEVYQATSKVASLHGWLLGYSCIFWILVIFGSRAVLIGSSFMGFCSFIYSTYNIASITEKDL